jgi:SAM-dependent methyltransferase
LRRAWRGRAGRVVRRTQASWAQRHLAVPGVDRLLERRWAARVREAPVMTPQQHAAAVADPARRAAALEVPVGCVLCGGARLRPLMHVHDRKRNPPRWNYHVVRCADCGFMFRHPGIRPERVGDLYSIGNYAEFLAGKYTRKRIRRYEVAMAGFGPLFERGDGRRLLDFGCGNGLFLDIAHERGFECHGVDLAADAIEVARRKPSGRHAYHGSPNEIPELAAGGFDVITLWSVLAHLAEPVEDLTMLRGLLAPDGVLVVLTVNANSLKLKRELESWGGFTPNHLVFFAPQTLRLLFARTGFASVAMPPWYGEPVERGTTRLGPRAQRNLRRTIDRGNRGNMLRAAAFADPDGPRRWGMDGVVLERWEQEAATPAARPADLAAQQR